MRVMGFTAPFVMVAIIGPVYRSVGLHRYEAARRLGIVPGVPSGRQIVHARTQHFPRGVAFTGGFSMN